MGSRKRKRKPASRLCSKCRRKTRHESGTCLSHRTEGPLPRYMARLDAAEAVCRLVDDRLTPSFDPKMDELLAKWMKMKERFTKGEEGKQ